MDTRTVKTRWISGAVLAALALTAVAPTAQADPGRGRGHGWGRERVIERAGYPQRTVVVRRSSSDFAPVLAGLIGGFVLGTAVSHAAPVEHVSTYYYVDPCDGDRYASLDRYEATFRYSHHPRVVEVIDARSGDCVRTMEWRAGDWRDCDRDARRSDWRDRDRDREYDDD